MDTMIVQQLLWELKPATIFEMGTHEGGSALWMADTMRSYGCNSQVYTVDLDTETIKPLAKQDKNITLVTGDLMKVEELLPAKMLQVWIDPSLFFFLLCPKGITVFITGNKRYKSKSYNITDDLVMSILLVSVHGCFWRSNLTPHTHWPHQISRFENCIQLISDTN